MMQTACPACSTLHDVPPDWLGETLCCTKCSANFVAGSATSAPVVLAEPVVIASQPTPGESRLARLDAAVAEMQAPDDRITRSFGWRDVPTDAPPAELGEGLGYYESEPGPMPFRRSRGVFMMWGGGVMILAGLCMIPLALSQQVPDKVGMWACALPPLGAFTMFVGWMGVTMHTYKLNYTTYARLWLCEHGLLWAKDNQYHAWRWQDIIGCRRIPEKSNIVTVSRVDYEFQVKDGPPLILAGTAQSFIVAHFMTDRIACAIWQHRMRPRWEADKPINFGAAKVDWKGIDFDDATISWEDAEKVDFHIEMFRVRLSDGDRYEVPFEQLHHPTLCRQLCETLIAVAHPEKPAPLIPSTPSGNPFDFA